MTDHTAQAQLRALRGEEPSLAQFLHFLGPGREEAAPHPGIMAARDPETQLRVACSWVSSRKQGSAPEPGHHLNADEYDIFAAACLSLRLLCAAHLQATHPVDTEHEVLAPVLLNIGIEYTTAIRNAAAKLELPDETVREIRSLMSLSDPGPRPAANTPARGWWHLRLQTHLTCSSLDCNYEPNTELTWLTTGHENTELSVMLSDWEALSRPLGENDPSSSVWNLQPSHVQNAGPMKLEAMRRQARMIMEALDTLNPDARDPQAAHGQSRPLQILSGLNVPHRSRCEGASGALLNLWLIARLPEHWDEFFAPVEERQATPREPEIALLRLLDPQPEVGAGTWGGALARLRARLN